MKEVTIRTISLTLLILTFIQIFGFSGQDSEESGSLSRKVTVKIVEVLPNTKNLSEEDKLELIDKLHPIIRKLAHFSLYTLVGIFGMTFISTFELKKVYQFFISLFIGLFYAISDEVHQSFIPGRACSIMDVGIDTSGVIFGIIIVFVCVWIYKLIKKYKK